jgi:phosphohistidine phosphatase
MQLYVIRHGIAEDPTPGSADGQRALTGDGVKRMKRGVRGMRELGWSFDRILSSPWQRAVETAELLHPLCDADPIVTDLLTQSPRSELLAMIAENMGGDRIAVVGHEPWLGELVAWLAFGDTRHGDALKLKKGGVTVLTGSAIPGGMEIVALVPPKLLRSL